MSIDGFSARRVVAAFCLLLSFGGVVAAAESSFSPQEKEKAVAALTEGVDALAKHGLPGPVATLGESAFPIVVGEYERGVFEPLVAGAFVEKGRVVAFGHTDYLSAASIAATPSSARFFANALRWTSGSDASRPASEIRVAVWRDPRTSELLKKQGFDATSVDKVPSSFDVFVAGAVGLNDEEYARIFEVVRRGAGFVTCGLGWGWSQLNPGKDLVRDHAGNRNFAKFGVALAWTDGYLDATKGNEYAARTPISEFVDGDAVVRFVAKISENPTEAANELAGKSAAELRQISSSASLIYRYLPSDERDVFDRLATEDAVALVPTSKAPIRSSDLIGRLTIAIQTERFLTEQRDGSTTADEVPALASGSNFPGVVPTEAPRLQGVKIAIKPAVPDWQTTGLYAAPGETISVRVAPEILAKLPRPLKIRIGAHSDGLWKLENWERYPEITLEKTISSPETTIANPFGGAIYVVVPRGVASVGVGVFDVEISGGVAAPYFVRDETSLDAWKTIRENPAPWAELQGRYVILSVPSSVVRQLNNPQELMETWDRVLDLIFEFSSTRQSFARPERICCDRQISAGYMHSGYPVMTGMDVERDFVDVNKLRTRGNWGFFHEFGHNRQSGFWTFEGSGEVTVNYFSLYVMQNLCGLAPEATRGELTKENRLKMLKRYFDSGAKFETWKSDPFLALNMTVQLQQEFGWEPFIRAVSEYTKASQSELPRTDDQKRDQWLIRLSRNAGKNLGPFFEKWGVPTSQAARDSLNDLPVWLPSEFDEL